MQQHDVGRTKLVRNTAAIHRKAIPWPANTRPCYYKQCCFFQLSIIVFVSFSKMKDSRETFPVGRGKDNCDLCAT